MEPLSVIIVHYGKDEYLLECLHSIAVSAPAGLVEVIVVNNTEHSLQEKLRTFPFVQEVFVGRNIGFGSAINRGAVIARAKILFFLNPDSKILLADTFERIVQRITADTEKKIGIIGGGLIDRTYRREAWGGGKAMRLRDIVVKRLFFWTSGKDRLRRSAVPVDWVSGAAFCIRKEDFDTLCGFDEAFFLYFEDMDLCLRSALIQKKVCYEGSVDILHYGGKSFSRRDTQKKHYFTSQKRYFQKHRPAWENKVLSVLHWIFLRKNGERRTENGKWKIGSV